MQNFKEFSVDLDEAVEISHDRYERSHGKKASGSHGQWLFTHKRSGDVDYSNHAEVHKTSGSFSDAKKSASKWAKEHGHHTAYVMESTVSEDTLTEEEDDKIFKNPNAKIKGASFKDASAAEHKKAIQYHKDEARRVSSSASISTGSRMSKTAFHNMRAKLHADHLKSIKEEAELEEGYGEGDIATGGTVIYKHEGKHVMSKVSHKTGGGAGTKIHTIAKHVVPLHHIVSTDASDWNHYKLKEEAELDEALDTHEMAMAHKDKASKALETSDMKSFHNHMSNHHESMGQWHESKGRHSAADREYAKAEEHHEKSLKPDNSRTVGVKNESTICTQCQSDPCICDDSHGFVTEAAQGHAIEAHGIRGMKGTPWRKTFKSHELLADWADKNDSIEVHGIRELDGVKKKTNEEAELDEVFADQGSGSTAKDNAEYMKRRKAAGATKHKVSVTVSEKDHPMVSKRLEKQQKFVKVSAGSKEEAVTKAKKFYSKQGYHVHGAEHHSMSEEVKSSSVPSFKQFIE